MEKLKHSRPAPFIHGKQCKVVLFLGKDNVNVSIPIKLDHLKGVNLFS